MAKLADLSDSEDEEVVFMTAEEREKLKRNEKEPRMDKTVKWSGILITLNLENTLGRKRYGRRLWMKRPRGFLWRTWNLKRYMRRGSWRHEMTPSMICMFFSYLSPIETVRPFTNIHPSGQARSFDDMTFGIRTTLLLHKNTTTFQNFNSRVRPGWCLPSSRSRRSTILTMSSQSKIYFYKAYEQDMKFCKSFCRGQHLICSWWMDGRVVHCAFLTQEKNVSGEYRLTIQWTSDVQCHSLFNLRQSEGF